MNTIQRMMTSAILMCLSVTGIAQEESQQAIESFIEPFKTIQIPATEIGTIVDMFVQEGQQVTRNEELALLDDRILQASLAAARSAKDATGNLRAAKAELVMKERQLKSLVELRSRGNATQREIDRAIADKELSEARLQAVQEELEVRRFEYERILMQIEKRTLRSPIDGVISKIDKDPGEFVAPTDPIVMTIVQLDPVVAVFSLPISAAEKVKVGEKVVIGLGVQDSRIDAFVDFIAPTADPKSGTRRVKVRIPNARREILSGSSCRWAIDGLPPDSFASGPSRRAIMATRPRGGSDR